MGLTSRCIQGCVVAIAACVAGPVIACPQLNRLIVSPPDGQLSMFNGSAPDGALAADDFSLPLGNGNNYQLRTVKFRMISNFVLTFSNVGFFIYSDISAGVSPPRPRPGTLVATAGNALPDVRDIGAYSGAPGYRQYEVTYAIPAGWVTLQPNRWYWLSPYAVAGVGPTQVAFAAVNTAAPIVGQVANSSNGTPGGGGAAGPGAFTSWALTTACCIPAADLSLLVKAVQIARPTLTDFTCDLIINIDDIFVFLNRWFAAAPEADFNGSSGVNIDDIFIFLNAWFAGQ